MRGPSEVVLLGSTDGVPLTDSDGRFEPLLSTGGRQQVILYFWNPDTLDYEIATSGGTGTGTEVQVTNFPATQTVNGTVIEERAAASSVASVAGSMTAVTILASNADRVGLRVYNDSGATLYLKFGTGATSTDFTKKMFPEAFFEDYQYTGVVTGAWTAASGAARVTELT